VNVPQRRAGHRRVHPNPVDSGPRGGVPDPDPLPEPDPLCGGQHSQSG
jgi:hypothetical protein